MQVKKERKNIWTMCIYQSQNTVEQNSVTKFYGWTSINQKKKRQLEMKMS